MNNDARSQASEGDIANLISVEVQKVCEIEGELPFFKFCFFMVSAIFYVFKNKDGKRIASKTSAIFCRADFYSFSTVECNE